MRKHALFSIFIITTGLFFINGALFASEEGPVFSFGLGMADGVGSGHDQAGLGSATYLGFGYRLNKRIQLGLDLTNARFGTTQTDVDAATTVDASALEGTVRVNFNPGSRYVVYGSAGLGPVFVNTTDHTGSSSNTEQNTVSCASLALGFDHPLAETWAFGLEGRYLQSESELVQAVTLIARLSFAP